MAGNQLPVLTLEFSDEKIQKLQDIAEKFKAALSVGPGGFPVPSTPPSPLTQQNPLPSVPPSSPAGGGGKPSGETTFEKFFKELDKLSEKELKTFGLINRTLKKTTSTLEGLFKTTVSWGVKIAAIGGGGGMFGYGYMTHHLTEQYKSPTALGITLGQQQAAHNVYGPRLSNVDSIMQSLAAAQNDTSHPMYAGLVNLNMDPRAGAAKNLPVLLDRVSSLLAQYKDSGVSQTILKAQGLDGVVDVATANQVLKYKNQIPGWNKDFQVQFQQLDSALGGDATVMKYQALEARFLKNADSMGNTLLKAVADLSGPLGELSDNVTISVNKFLHGPNGKALFTTIADGVKDFASWIGSDQFQTDLETFSTDMVAIAKAVGAALHWVATHLPEIDLDGVGVGPGETRPELTSFANKYLGGQLPGANPMTNKYTGAYYKEDDVYAKYQMPGAIKKEVQDFVIRMNKAAHLPNGLMSAVAGVESSWNPFALNKGSGAAGLFQFMPGTAKAYGLKDGEVFDPQNATMAASRYFHDLDKRYKGDVAKMLTAYNGGKFDKDGNPSLKKETVDYLLKILPQVNGAIEQHPGIMRQLGAARTTLAHGGKNDRVTIEVVSKEGADVVGQVVGQSTSR